MLENITFHQFILFFVAFVRVGTIMATVPFFGFEAVPVQMKAGLSFAITLILFPFLDKVQAPIPRELLPFILMILNEVLVGLAIGFVSAILFVGIRFAGTIIGLEMGFGIVNVIDPQSGQQVSIVGQFKYLLALLLFISLNGHHFLLEAIQLSFQVVPVSGGVFRPVVAQKIIVMSRDVFIVALKVASTTMATLFLVTIVMGILARLVPQMNIFIVGFPLKISIGLVMLYFGMPFFMYVFEKMYITYQKDVIEMIGILH